MATANRKNLDMVGADAGRLNTLTRRLQGHGIDVPDIDKYLELSVALTVLRPEPLEKPDLLHATKEDLALYAETVATRSVINRHVGGGLGTPFESARSALAQELEAAMLVSLRANAPAIITALAVPFKAAADEFRAAVKLGIEPEDDLRSLFEADAEVRQKWLSLKDHAETLDSILRTRQLLSFIAGVEPSLESLYPRDLTAYRQGHGTGIDWSVAVIKDTSKASLGVRDKQAPWARWLAVAPHLALTAPPAGPFEALGASNPSVARRLIDVAQQRTQKAS